MKSYIVKTKLWKVYPSRNNYSLQYVVPDFSIYFKFYVRILKHIMDILDAAFHEINLKLITVDYISINLAVGLLWYDFVCTNTTRVIQSTIYTRIHVVISDIVAPFVFSNTTSGWKWYERNANSTQSDTNVVLKSLELSSRQYTTAIFVMSFHIDEF